MKRLVQGATVALQQPHQRDIIIVTIINFLAYSMWTLLNKALFLPCSEGGHFGINRALFATSVQMFVAGAISNFVIRTEAERSNSINSNETGGGVLLEPHGVATKSKVSALQHLLPWLAPWPVAAPMNHRRPPPWWRRCAFPRPSVATLRRVFPLCMARSVDIGGANTALKYVSVAVQQVVKSTLPIFVSLLSWWWLNKRLTRLAWFALVPIAVGTVLAVLRGSAQFAIVSALAKVLGQAPPPLQELPQVDDTSNSAAMTVGLVLALLSCAGRACKAVLNGVLLQQHKSNKAPTSVNESTTTRVQYLDSGVQGIGGSLASKADNVVVVVVDSAGGKLLSTNQQQQQQDHQALPSPLQPPLATSSSLSSTTTTSSSNDSGGRSNSNDNNGSTTILVPLEGALSFIPAPDKPTNAATGMISAGAGGGSGDATVASHTAVGYSKGTDSSSGRLEPLDILRWEAPLSGCVLLIVASVHEIVSAAIAVAGVPDSTAVTSSRNDMIPHSHHQISSIFLCASPLYNDESTTTGVAMALVLMRWLFALSLLISGGVLMYFNQATYITIIDLTSPVTCQVLMNVKMLMLIVFAVWWFSTPLSWLNVGGVAIAGGGCFLYAFASTQRPPAPREKRI